MAFWRKMYDKCWLHNAGQYAQTEEDFIWFTDVVSKLRKKFPEAEVKFEFTTIKDRNFADKIIIIFNNEADEAFFMLLFCDFLC